ncbi:MAG: hypothetical protein ABFD94_15710 [Armatimonadia bacterium]
MANATLQGKKTGGSPFPRFTIVSLECYIADIVSKTNSRPLKAEDLAAALRHSSYNTAAQTKLASLRAYGLVSGTNKAVKATELARAFYEATTEDQRAALRRQAIANVKMFKDIVETAATGSSIEAAGKTAVSRYKVAESNRVKLQQVLQTNLLDAGIGLAYQFVELPTEDEGLEPADDDDPPEAQNSDEEHEAEEPEVHAGTMPPPAVQSTTGISVSVSIQAGTGDTKALEEQLALLASYGLLPNSGGKAKKAT